ARGGLLRHVSRQRRDRVQRGVEHVPVLQERRDRGDLDRRGPLPGAGPHPGGALMGLRIAGTGLLLGLLGCAGGTPPAGAPAPAGGARLYVVNQGGASIAVIDQQALAVDTVIDLTAMGFSPNAKPHHIAVEPDGSAWYVSLI